MGIYGYEHGDKSHGHNDPAIKNMKARKQVGRAYYFMIVVNSGAPAIK